MKKPWVVLTGMAAFAPIVSMVAIPLLWNDPPLGNYEAARAQADAFHNLLIGLTVVTYMMIGFFVIFTFRSNVVPAGKRGLWAALLFFGNAFILPFFWFWYIWRDSNSSSDETTSST